MRRTQALRALVVAAALSLSSVSFASVATTAGASPAPLTIAYITDVTGQAAAENGTSPAAFEARIDLQNAEGGVNGHKLVPILGIDALARHCSSQLARYKVPELWRIGDLPRNAMGKVVRTELETWFAESGERAH